MMHHLQDEKSVMKHGGMFTGSLWELTQQNPGDEPQYARSCSLLFYSPFVVSLFQLKRENNHMLQQIDKFDKFPM